MSRNLTIVNASEDYFKIVFEDRPLKYVGLCVSFVFVLVMCSLTFGIIWFEHFGSDIKRIFINRIVSCACWVVLQGYILFQVPDLFLYIYRPYPVWICYIQTILRHAFVLQLLLLLDALLISRYIFIFWLKNPLNFDDKFWCSFVTLGIFIFSYIAQAIYIWMPGRQSLQFYLCSNQLNEDLEQLPYKHNWVSIVILILSLILYIVVNVKIEFFKRKQKQAPLPLTHVEQNKCENVDFVEKRSLSNYVTSACTILGTSAFLSTLLGINMSSPKTFTQGDNYLFVYYLHFIFPLLMTVPTILSLYIKNPEMRKSLFRELQTQWNPSIEMVSDQLTNCANAFKKCFDRPTPVINLQV